MQRTYYSLYGRLLERARLIEAFKQVKRAKGAAGIDGQTCADFEVGLEDEISCLMIELKEKRYQPCPVKRVTIEKEDGGTRDLGIPTVRDRVVQAALTNILSPIYEPDFHPSSYGYRPGRSGQHAISKATLFIRKYDRKWVVDLDLSKCFDTLDHDIIIATFKKKVTDGSILKLLRAILESGVMIGSEYAETVVGSPQGGVISPLIANVYLDQYDQFMKSRGHRIVRYADDILVICNTQKAAENALKVSKCYLEKELKLKVNDQKTHVCHSKQGVKFLGVEIHTTHTAIQEKKIVRLKKKLKQITKRNTSSGVLALVQAINPLLRGFVNYFRIANCAGTLKNLIAWMRRRLRCIQLRQWKTPGRLHRRLKQLGRKPPFKRIKMQSWRNANSPLANMSMPNQWFHKELKLVDLTSYTTGISALEIG